MASHERMLISSSEFKNIPTIINRSLNYNIMKKTLLTLGLFTFGLAQVALMQAQAIPNDPLFSLQWSHRNNGNVPIFNSPGTCGSVSCDLDILAAWLNLDQRKFPVDIIHVGILDSGLDPNHPDMTQSRVLAGKNFTANNYTATTNNTADVLGHGTHVTGAIAATANNAIGIAGIDRSCKVMPILINPACFIGQRGHIARAIRHAADSNMKVINMSWGWDEITVDLEIREAMSYAIAKGCVFVGAAGNDNATTVDFPAKAVIAVGAANPCGSIKSGIPPLSCEYDTRPEGNEPHWGSNVGIGLDVMGPGTMLPAIDIQGAAGLSAGNCAIVAACYHSDATGNYVTDAYGTSIAAPCITGIVSQMLSVNPGLKMHEVEYLLKASTKTMQGGYRWPVTEAAIRLAEQFVLGSRPLADLAVSSVKYERMGPAMVKATVVVRNLSNSVSSSASSLEVYTSNNDSSSYDDARRTGTTVNIPALSPGTSYTSTVTFQDASPPFDTPTEKLWLNAIVDPAMILEEIDDANNARNVEVPRHQVLADLIVSGLSAVSVSSGKLVTCKIKNIGSYPAYFPLNSPIVQLLEYDALVSGAPVLIHTISSVSLTVNPNQEITYTVTVPTSKTHLMAYVDPPFPPIIPAGRIAETNEANNTYVISLQSSGMEEEEIPGGGSEDSTGAPGKASRAHRSEPNRVLPANPELQLELFPNPATDNVTIAVELPGRAQLVLADLLGNELYTYGLEEAGKHYLRFDATGLSPGVYVVKLSQMPGKSLTKKLIIR